jgi:hypothetical protein
MFGGVGYYTINFLNSPSNKFASKSIIETPTFIPKPKLTLTVVHKAVISGASTPTFEVMYETTLPAGEVLPSDPDSFDSNNRTIAIVSFSLAFLIFIGFVIFLKILGGKKVDRYTPGNNSS